MKKIYPTVLSSLMLSLVILFSFSGATSANSCLIGHPELNTTPPPLVQCGQYPDCQCEIADFFIMMVTVYRFLVLYIATPLGALCAVGAGVLYIISGGNPGTAQKAKNILTYSVIGLVLVFGSWLIIDIVLKAIGYVLPWNTI